MSHHIPFQERKTPWRGLLDLATGRYPAFLFGGRVGNLLPMFHFHDVTADYLTPYFRYLAENRYRTVNSTDLARFVREGIDPGPRAVALCFDDAWASLWTIVLPLLQKFNLTAITYAIPGRVEDAAETRPQTDAAAQAGPPLATWPELQALQASGLVDVQAHTQTHAMIYCHDRPCGFVTPAYRPAALAEAFTGTAEAPAYLPSGALGEPLYPMRSRCSDARRFHPDPAARQACREHVARHGGAAYFQTPQWQQPLMEIMQKAGGIWESKEESIRAIRTDLDLARTVLNRELGSKHVQQICFPWAIAGRHAEAMARELGYRTAVADRLGGKRAVQPGGNPFRLMRLKHQFIFALPGQPRRTFLQIRRKTPS